MNLSCEDWLFEDVLLLHLSLIEQQVQIYVALIGSCF
jgi:hypothetical protein